MLFPKVDNNVPPDETSTSLSPLTSKVTGPDGKSLAFTPKSIATRRNIIKRKTITLRKIYVDIDVIIYNLIPIKLINPSAIRPVIINVIPSPLNGAGTFEYAIFSLIAAIATIAKNQPTPEPNP